MRILLVEDQKKLAMAVVHILKQQGYQVDARYDGDEGQAMAESGIYDLIILDRMLPGRDGVSICRALRQQGLTVPILFLTAKDTVADKVEGLDAGADDYLVKPFAGSELLARVRALLRRNETLHPENTCELRGLQLQTDEGLLSVNEGQPMKLTGLETHLLELLMRHKGQTLTKAQILDRVWGFDSNGSDGNVELYIYYLRKKIDFAAAQVELQTVRGVGYCLKELK